MEKVHEFSVHAIEFNEVLRAKLCLSLLYVEDFVSDRSTALMWLR